MCNSTTFPVLVQQISKVLSLAKSEQEISQTNGTCEITAHYDSLIIILDHFLVMSERANSSDLSPKDFVHYVSQIARFPTIKTRLEQTSREFNAEWEIMSTTSQKYFDSFV